MKGPSLLEKESCRKEPATAEEITKVKDLVDGDIGLELGPHRRSAREEPEGAEPDETGDGPKERPVRQGWDFHDWKESKVRVAKETRRTLKELRRELVHLPHLVFEAFSEPLLDHGLVVQEAGTCDALDAGKHPRVEA